MHRRLLIIISFTAVVFLSPADLWANNLRISNVSLEDRDSGADTVVVQFDISWDNSWRNTTNHDAAWIFLKACDTTVEGSNCEAVDHSSWQHGVLKTAGLNPADTSSGTNGDLDIYIPSDKRGAFLRRKSSGTGTMNSTQVRLTLNYNSNVTGCLDLANDTDKIKVRAFGIEMVFIPEGPFYLGDNSGLNYSFRVSSVSTAPWYISSEALIRTSATNESGRYYTSTGRSGEAATGNIFTIPAAFPKGYAAIYCMKYELTEGQYVDFATMLYQAGGAPGGERDITYYGENSDGTRDRGKGGGSDGWVWRNTIAGGEYINTFTTDRPDRAMTYLNWPDLAAYLDWAALRPMTELEFEKIARGPLSPVFGEYAWGNSTITQAVTFSISPENGIETFTTSSANAVYSSTAHAIMFAQGDKAAYGDSDNYRSGPARAGIFAGGSSTRAEAGAGYYGVMELTGNVAEMAVLVGDQTRGIGFQGTQGDGVLACHAGAGGANADAYVSGTGGASWPGTSSGIVTYATFATHNLGMMIRGGDWASGSNATSTHSYLPISGRYGFVTYATPGMQEGQEDGREGINGGRGVRTYDGTDF